MDPSMQSGIRGGFKGLGDVVKRWWANTRYGDVEGKNPYYWQNRIGGLGQQVESTQVIPLTDYQVLNKLIMQLEADVSQAPTYKVQQILNNWAKTATQKLLDRVKSAQQQIDTSLAALEQMPQTAERPAAPERQPERPAPPPQEQPPERQPERPAPPPQEQPPERQPEPPQERPAAVAEPPPVQPGVPGVSARERTSVADAQRLPGGDTGQTAAPDATARGGCRGGKNIGARILKYLKGEIDTAKIEAGSITPEEIRETLKTKVLAVVGRTTEALNKYYNTTDFTPGSVQAALYRYRGDLARQDPNSYPPLPKHIPARKKAVASEQPPVAPPPTAKEPEPVAPPPTAKEPEPESVAHDPKLLQLGKQLYVLKQNGSENPTQDEMDFIKQMSQAELDQWTSNVDPNELIQLAKKYKPAEPAKVAETPPVQSTPKEETPPVSTPSPAGNQNSEDMLEKLPKEERLTHVLDKMDSPAGRDEIHSYVEKRFATSDPAYIQALQKKYGQIWWDNIRSRTTIAMTLVDAEEREKFKRKTLKTEAVRYYKKLLQSEHRPQFYSHKANLLPIDERVNFYKTKLKRLVEVS